MLVVVTKPIACSQRPFFVTPTFLPYRSAFRNDGYTRLGEGLIASGKHYDSAPGAYHGFVYRKNLDGAELWRHPTRSSAASIKTTPDGRILVVAFLDGSLAVLHGDTGDIAQWDAFKPDSFSTVIVSLDIDETHILFGTLDGRFGVAPVSDLMGSV
jgi:hypothetical protein